MPVLAVLANPILPVFAILALGFLLGRRGWMSVDQARLVNKLAMTILLPILLFDLLASAPILSFPLAPIAVYAGVQVLVFTLLYQLARRAFQVPPNEAIVLGLDFSYLVIFASPLFQ